MAIHKRLPLTVAKLQKHCVFILRNLFSRIRELVGERHFSCEIQKRNRYE
jgi:hypothetical protein